MTKYDTGSAYNVSRKEADMIPSPKELRQMKEQIFKAYSKMLDYDKSAAELLWSAAQDIGSAIVSIELASDTEEVNSILEWMDLMDADGKDWRTQQREERP